MSKEINTSQTLWDTGDDNQKVLTWVYLISGLTLWFVLGSFFEYCLNLLFTFDVIPSSMVLQIERLPVSPGFIVGGLVALGLGMYARKDEKVNGFGLDVVAELKKVTWPPLPVTWKSTFAVIITVIICGFVLAFFDYVWGSLANLLLL